MLFWPFSPGEAVPCRLRNEAKAYKRNTETNLISCTGTALRKENYLINRRYNFLLTGNERIVFIGACSPAVRCSPDVKSGAAAAIRFTNSVGAQAASKMKYGLTFPKPKENHFKLAGAPIVSLSP